MRYVLEPSLTHLLAAELLEKAQVPKPTAKGTPLRYSSAYGCMRQQGYAAIGAVPTEPMDESGAWVTGLGTIIHEALQEAISKVYPNAEFEVASQHGSVISGSCDALVEVDGEWVLFELKTMGTYSFDKQVGWNRMRGTVGTPEGPAQKAIVQAGMNALGIEKERGITINTIIMGSIGFEALSKQKADKVGIEGYNRFLAEFHIDREEWEPIAQAELTRMVEIYDTLAEGVLPDRWAIDDEGTEIQLSPEGRAWQCAYCAFKTTCSEDGPGIIHVLDSFANIEENN